LACVNENGSIIVSYGALNVKTNLAFRVSLVYFSSDRGLVTRERVMSEIQVVAWTVVGFMAFIHMVRSIIMRVKNPSKNHQDFAGDLLQVGKSVVAYQGASNPDVNPKRTVVCMHGWLEDHRYFTEVYNGNNNGPMDELILINSCDYHMPNTTRVASPVDWQTPNPHPPCTIEYDAAVLVMAVKNLATSANIVLHGHSRGGAVVIEAIKQAPELLSQAHVILEAPMLPEASIARTHKLPKLVSKALSKFAVYIFPFAMFYLSRKPVPTAITGKGKHNKRILLSGLFFSAKNAGVLVRNFENILAWPMQNKMDILDGVRAGCVLVGEKDTVLSRRLLLKSASKLKGNINVIQTQQTGHFISLDIPEQVKSLNFNTAPLTLMTHNPEITS